MVIKVGLFSMGNLGRCAIVWEPRFCLASPSGLASQDHVQYFRAHACLCDDGLCELLDVRSKWVHRLLGSALGC